MRIYAFRHDILASQCSFLQSVGVVIMDADALHAGIDLEMNDGFLAETLCGAVDLLESFDRGGGEREIVLDEIGDLFFPDATEDEDGGVDAHLTQEDALFEDGDADIVGLRGEVTSDPV